MKSILRPISHPALNNINIDDNPIIIGRIMESFRSLNDEAVTRLSRRHARIFRDNGELYLIDLGSLNGTQVNGQPVEEDVARLLNGDEINFAGDLLFRVQMEAANGDEKSAGVQPIPQLMLVPIEPIETDSGIEPILVPRFPFLISRSYTLFGQYMEQYMEDVRQISRPHAIIGLTDDEIYIEDLESVNGTFLDGKELDAGKNVLADGATIAFGGSRFTYRVSLEQAEQTEYVTASGVTAVDRDSLDDDADDSLTIVNSSRTFTDLYSAEDSASKDAGNESDADLQKKPAPGISMKSENQRRKRSRLFTGFRPARGKVSGYNRKLVAIGVGIGVYTLAFVLISSLHIPGSDKREIMALVDNNAYTESADAANQYLNNHPDDDSFYGKAISELKNNIVDSIANSDYQRLDRVIADFAGQYPKFRGLDALRQDADNFKLLASQVEQRVLTDVETLRQEIEFQTPWVIESVREWLAQVLPPVEVITKYHQAAEAWRHGESKKAIELLSELKTEQWSEVAERKEARYTEVVAAYKSLQEAKESKTYNEHLLAFQALLIPSEDEYFIGEIEPDIQLRKKQIQIQLQTDFDRIKQHWVAYQNANGIPGVVLVEGRVSKRFKRQAKRLSTAYREIIEGSRRYEMIQTEEPTGWQQLKEKIVSETKRQSRWLKDLDTILEPAIITAKLDLLPDMLE